MANRVQGRADKLARYDELTASNADAQRRIVQAFDAAIDGAMRLDGVALSDRVRVADELRRYRGTVRSADLSPHPAAVDRLVEEAS